MASDVLPFSSSARVIAPVPYDVARTLPPNPHGVPTTIWDYMNAEGRLMMRICRWDFDDGTKEIRPLTYCELPDGKRAWHWKGLEGSRPLLGLVDLGARPDARVIIVEGEKTRDAAVRWFPDCVVVTSAGGARAARKTDFSPLKLRHVVVIPDNDDAGLRYADDVMRSTEAAGGLVSRVILPDGLPAGWDLADRLPPGIEPTALRAAVDCAFDTVPAVDLKAAGLTRHDALLTICDGVTPWQSADGGAYVSFTSDGHVEHHAVRSTAFRNWLLIELSRQYSNKGRPASANDNQIREALLSVEARARHSRIVHSAAIRAVDHDCKIYLDLGRPDWSVAEISSQRWSVVARAPVPILRSRRAAPFPDPANPADLKPLRELLAHLDNDSFVLIVAWCVAALLPYGPYPILLLTGEQGSGKSMLTRLVQRIADPVNGDPMQPPRSDRDLVAVAKGNRVLAFDNLSELSATLADSFCRLSTGSEFGGRALFTDHDTATFTASRPLVMNGIADLAVRGDLADRAIVIHLPPLPARVTERDWWARVEKVLPQAFASLLNAIREGLQHLDETPTPNVRMADFARFVTAAETALGWSSGTFMAAYERSRKETNAALADGDSVVRAIRQFMADRSAWQGLMSDLYRELDAIDGANRSTDWPGAARWFGDRLRRAAPTLRSLGIEVRNRRQARGVVVTLSRIATPEAPTPSNTQAKARDDSSDASVAMEPTCTAVNADDSEG